MKNIFLLIFNILASLIIGFFLARYLVDLPYEMSWIIESIRFIVRATGHHELDNPDDLGTLVLTFFLLASIIFVGVLVWLCNIGVRRYLSARSANSH